MNAICIPVWNRPEYLRVMLNNLKLLREIDRWAIFIQIDPSPRLEEILSIIKFSELPCEIYVEANNKILGVRGNTFHCIEVAAKRGADYFLYIEDDLEISKDALEFVEFSMSNRNFSDHFVSGNLHFSGCSNHAHFSIPKPINPIWPHLALNSQFLSSYGLFFCRSQYEKFISKFWWTQPLKVRDLRGNRGAGWDYALTQALLENNFFCLQSLLPRVRHVGVEGVHCNPEEYEKGWAKADLWPGNEKLKNLQIIKPNDNLLGDLGAFVSMAKQCWTIQQHWLFQDQNLSKIAKNLRQHLL